MSYIDPKMKDVVMDQQTNLAREGEIQVIARFMHIECIITKDTCFTWGLEYQILKNGYYSHLSRDDKHEEVSIDIFQNITRSCLHEVAARPILMRMQIP